jgi:hypothetical protein
MSDIPFEIKPYDKDKVVRPPNIQNLNYTNQDFFSMKTRLVDFINERFGSNGTVLPNTFNDFVESSVAIMLIENWAFLADTLSFKIDQIANELFIDTVTETENAFRLAKLVGFKPTPPIAARSFWVATINNVLTTDLVLPTPVPVDIVSGGTPTRMELFPANSNNVPLLDENIIIQAGSTSNQNIIGLEGRTVTDVLTGTGDSSQTFTLVSSPVIFDSIRVDVDGIRWDQVDYFTDSQPRREYRVEFDSAFQAVLIFGNNRAGMIPSRGSRIQVTYRIGGGTVGNIITGFVNTQRMADVPGFSFAVPVTLRNYTKGEFGYDGDTIEDVRRKLPLWLRTQNRAVTGEDYKVLADQFSTAYHGKIGKSTAVLRNHGCAGNIVDLYVLASDSTDTLVEAGSDLKVDLNDELTLKKMLTDFVCIKDGVVIAVDVSVDLTLDKFYRKFELELRTNILNKINSFFSINNWEYGQTLRDTEIVKELSGFKEIQLIDVSFTTNDPENSGNIVTTRFFEIIRPSDIVISFNYN